MLKKLLKYDLYYLNKIVCIFAIFTLIFAVSYRLLIRLDSNMLLSIITKIINGVAISMMASLVINVVIRLFVRFTSNFYGDESYLTHALPVSKNKLLLSKFISAILITLYAFAIILIAVFIMYYTKERWITIVNYVKDIANGYNINVIPYIVLFLVMFFLEFVLLIISGFCCIVIGHKANSKKILLSIISGYLIYQIAGVLILGIVLVIGIFDHDLILFLFKDNHVFPDIILRLFIYITILYSIFCVIVYGITAKLFNKGVDVL